MQAILWVEWIEAWSNTSMTRNESVFIWILVHFWNPINVWQIKLFIGCLYSEGSENRFMVVLDLWCRQNCQIVCRVSMKLMKSKFLYQDVHVVSLADKGIVVRCFVCRNYDTVLMETGKFCDNIIDRLAIATIV